MKKVMTFLFIILFVYSALVAFFYVFQAGFLFFPQKLNRDIPLNENTEEIFFKAADNNTLHGWLCKSQSDQQQKLIIYFGGNAEEVSHLIPTAPQLGEWSLLLINYPGYGKSEGKAGEKEFFKAALEIYDYAASRDDIDKENIVVMGRSIGTGSAVYLAHKRQTKAVILISPFESIRAVAQAKMPFLPVGLILCHRFENKRYAKEIAAPLLAFYGTNDDIIPPAHSKKLTKFWKGKTTLIELQSFNHNDIFESRTMWGEINKFLNGL